MNNYNFQHFLFSLALIGLSAMVSCNKEQDTIAIITVHDSTGSIASGASVNIKAGSYIDETKNTGSDGKVTFILNEYYEQGQFGLAVMDIIATKGSETGIGVIQVTEETTNEALVELAP